MADSTVVQCVPISGIYFDSFLLQFLNQIVLNIPTICKNSIIVSIAAYVKRKIWKSGNLCIFAVQYRGVEQLVARRAHNPEVGGPSPPPATNTKKKSRLDAWTSSFLWWFFSFALAKYLYDVLLTSAFLLGGFRFIKVQTGVKMQKMRIVTKILRRKYLLS